MKLKKVAIVCKVGSKESEETAKGVAKKFLAKKSKVYIIAPIEVKGTKKIESLEELKKEKLDLVVALGGDSQGYRGESSVNRSWWPLASGGSPCTSSVPVDCGGCGESGDMYVPIAFA